MNHWNIDCLSPRFASYSQNEINEELIHASKAFHTCKAIADIYAECRTSLMGQYIEPEGCLVHAEALQNCYNFVKQVPSICQERFTQLNDCLKGTQNCTKFMEEYIQCEHPATEIYEAYADTEENIVIIPDVKVIQNDS